MTESGPAAQPLVFDISKLPSISTAANESRFGGGGQSQLSARSNTPVFVLVWQKLFRQRMMSEHDWVVHVDPFTVFLPKRLRERLPSPSTAPLAIGNCLWDDGARGGDPFNLKFTMLFGALEVVNAAAAIQLAAAAVQLEAGIDSCKASTEHGEENFLRSCAKQGQWKVAMDVNIVMDSRCGPTNRDGCVQAYLRVPRRGWLAIKPHVRSAH